MSPGRTVTVTAPAAGAVSGAPVLIGSLFGIAAFSAPANAPLEICTEGVYDLSKNPGDTFSAGDKAYFIAASGLITSTATSNSWVGVVTQGVNGSGTSVRVRLNQHPI